MKNLTLSLFLSLSVTSIASPLCLYHYGPQKTELRLIYSALTYHVEKKELSEELTRHSIKNFLEIMDPFKFIFTKEEVQNFLDISKEDLTAMRKELTSSPSRNFHAYIQKLASERLYNFITAFNKNKDIRSEVEKRIELYEVNPQLLSDLSQRPESFDQSISQFFDYMAAQALKNKKISSQKMSTRESLVMAIRDFREEVIENSYLYQNPQLPFLISKSFIDALDAHSSLLMGPENHEMINRLFRSEFAGLGIGITPNMKGLQIEEVSPGYGAEKAGLQKNDIITHIKVTEKQKENFYLPLDSKNQSWLPIRALSKGRVIDELLLGNPNSFAEIRILREGRPLEVKVQRFTISKSETSLHSKLYSTPQGNVAYVKLDIFYNRAGDHIAKLIKNLKKQRAEGLVLDLRFNGGGSVMEFQKILGLFVKEGPAMITKSSNGDTTVLPIIKEETHPLFPLWNKPVIVLVNKYSASASEALSGALKDYDRAIIIGEDASTYGKGSMQSVRPLGDMATAKITEQLFSSPAGGHKQFDGVKPDILIEGPSKKNFAFERDLENAIKPYRSSDQLQNSNPFIENKKQLIKKLNKTLKTYRNQDQTSEKIEDETLAKSVFLMSEWMSQK